MSINPQIVTKEELIREIEALRHERDDLIKKVQQLDGERLRLLSANTNDYYYGPTHGLSMRSMYIDPTA